MWRPGVLFLLAVLVAVAAAGFEYGASLQRLKRSPGYGYDCPPPFHRHHRGWGPYPPPPFGHPPPPPYGPPPPPFGPPPSSWRDDNSDSQGQSFSNSDAKSQALTEQKGNEGGYLNAQQQQQAEIPKAPCEKCGKGQSSAISNAQSGTGDAIAIAISGKNTR